MMQNEWNQHAGEIRRDLVDEEVLLERAAPPLAAEHVQRRALETPRREVEVHLAPSTVAER